MEDEIGQFSTLQFFDSSFPIICRSLAKLRNRGICECGHGLFHTPREHYAYKFYEYYVKNIYYHRKYSDQQFVRMRKLLKVNGDVVWFIVFFKYCRDFATVKKIWESIDVDGKFAPIGYVDLQDVAKLRSDSRRLKWLFDEKYMDKIIHRFKFHLRRNDAKSCMLILDNVMISTEVLKMIKRPLTREMTKVVERIEQSLK